MVCFLREGKENNDGFLVGCGPLTRQRNLVLSIETRPSRSAFWKGLSHARNVIPLKRSALEMTETEDNDMAAPAIIGLSSMPVKG